MICTTGIIRTYKNFIIVALCELKNTVYLVTEDEKPVATFQTKQVGKTMRFEKLACSPKHSGKGIGSFCIHRRNDQESRLRKSRDGGLFSKSACIGFLPSQRL